jgi:predicted RNase H-like HicB family nuclease
MRYAVVFERTQTGWSAYVPDLPGIAVTGATMEEMRSLVASTIEFHARCLREAGDPVPRPTTRVEEVEADAA